MHLNTLQIIFVSIILMSWVLMYLKSKHTKVEGNEPHRCTVLKHFYGLLIKTEIEWMVIFHFFNYNCNAEVLWGRMAGSALRHVNQYGGDKKFQNSASQDLDCCLPIRVSWFPNGNLY